MFEIISLAVGFLAGIVAARKYGRMRIAYLQATLGRTQDQLDQTRLHAEVVDRRYCELLMMPAYVRKANALGIPIPEESRN
jgi:hypothetical protein